MKGFLRSKLVITLAAFIMIAAAVVIPLSGNIVHSHAAAPKGEQPLSPSQRTHNDPLGAPITITTDCSASTLQTIGTVNKGDQVQSIASLTSSDPNEASENENLHLQEQNSQFTVPIATVTITNSPQTFFFAASAFNDTLTACVDGIDSDDTPTVTLTITPIPTIDITRNDPEDSPSATFRGGPAEPNPTVVTVVNCLIDLIPAGTLAKLGLGTAATIVRVVQFVFGKGIPAVVIFQDLTTGKLIQATLELGKIKIPLESCIETIGLILDQLKVVQVS